MAPFRKLKKVSWAPDSSLCQIRQFSSEDCPSKVGLGVDDNMQLKHSHRSQFNFTFNNLSPEFSRTCMKKSEKIINIPSVKWKSPPKVNLNPNWLVASGEQSQEVNIQKQRELKVFEAVYPQLTDIPHSPSGALRQDENLPDDCITPTIRITPIEEEESLLDSSSVASPKLPAVSVSQPPGLINIPQCVNSVQKPHSGGTRGIISCAEADVGAAASAALTALLKSNEIGSSIDTNILIDIFNNPETVSMLLNRSLPASTKPPRKTTSEQVSPSTNFPCPSTDDVSSASASGKWNGTQNEAFTHCTSTTLQPRYIADAMVNAKAVTSHPSSAGGTVMTPSRMPSFRKASQINITNEVPLQTTVNEIKSHFSSAAVTPKVRLPPLVKDANYYKNLIKQHGSDILEYHGKIQHSQQSHHQSSYPDYGLNQDGRRFAENLKPCMFFNTPRGCRKGFECPFQHDKTPYKMQAANFTEVSNAKRMKLGR